MTDPVPPAPIPAPASGSGETTSRLRTVVAHEWLLSASGSDKVAAELIDLLGPVGVVTALADHEVVARLTPGASVRALWTDRLPGAHRSWMRYAPLLLAAWAATDVTHGTGPVDALVTSTHFGAMGAGHRFDGPHVAYCHSPLRYAWRPDLEDDRLRGPAALVGRGVRPALRRFDRWNARTVTTFVANSSAVRARIADCYGRDSIVVHPPVDVDRFAAISRPVPASGGSHWLCFGRLVGYKRADLAVAACTAVGVPLVVAGDGPELERLRDMAGPTVRFETSVDDARYDELLASARGLLFPGEEDFGIVPVEAMAAGVPVVAFGRGGALDTVVDGETGVHFAQQSTESLLTAMERLDRTSFDEDRLRRHARRFDRESFRSAMRSVVDGAVR